MIMENKMCDKKCANCKFFEERTKFCRKNPPQANVVYENGKTFFTSTFPKIQMPEIDFCWQHEFNIL